MSLTKEERYARHREYQKTPEARAKRIAYDKARYQTAEYKATLKARQATPKYKERARIAGKKYRSSETAKIKRRAYKQTPKAKDARRNQLFIKNFGITLEHYNRLYAEQRGVCAICEKPETLIVRGVPYNLAVDHCHVTGRVRGLLCRDCNQGIGKFHDTVALFARATSYLQQYGI